MRLGKFSIFGWGYRQDWCSSQYSGGCRDQIKEVVKTRVGLRLGQFPILGWGKDQTEEVANTRMGVGVRLGHF